MKPDAAQHRLDDLRRFRNRAEPDLSLGFLRQQFQRDIARPAKHLEAIALLWQQRLPGRLVDASRLESLARGVLTVTVRSSVELYELDRLLRGGLQRELVAAHRGPAFRKVRLKVGAVESAEPRGDTPPGRARG